MCVHFFVHTFVIILRNNYICTIKEHLKHYMEVLSVRDYRNNLATYFDRAAEGEKILIRRKNSLYALVSVGNEDLTLSPTQQRHVEGMTESIKRSWEQIKQMEAGEIPTKSAMSFIDEL